MRVYKPRRITTTCHQMTSPFMYNGIGLDLTKRSSEFNPGWKNRHPWRNCQIPIFESIAAFLRDYSSRTVIAGWHSMFQQRNESMPCFLQRSIRKIFLSVKSRWRLMDGFGFWPYRNMLMYIPCEGLCRSTDSAWQSCSVIILSVYNM